MKKATALILLLCLSFAAASPAFCVSLDGYEPYDTLEFPKWALDLRRAECLFFGGLPIAFPMVSLVSGLAGSDLSFVQTLGIACSVTAVIAIADYLIGVFRAD